MSEVSRKEIVEIFNRNQLACDEYVTPSIKEWNKIGAHIDKLTAQVAELKAALMLMSDDSYHSQLWFDCGYHKQIDELLTRIGDKDA